MKKLLKKTGITLLAFFLIFASVFSMAGTQDVIAQGIEWEEMAGKTTKEVDKTWTIKFSTNLDAASINGNNLFIVNAEGEKVETTFTVDKNLIKVSPKTEYQNGQSYTLYIGPDLKSDKGKMLKTPIKFTFLVDAETISTPVIYPSNQVPTNFYEDGFRLAVSLSAATDDLAEYDEANDVSSVKLYSKDEEGKWLEIGRLFDSGSMPLHSDEIRGDGVYTIKLYDKIDTTAAKSLDLKVAAELKDGTTLQAFETLTIVQTSNGQNVYEVLNIASSAQAEVEAYAAEKPDVSVNDLEEVVTGYLSNQETVESVNEEAEGLLEVTYDSGLKSLIQIIEQEDAEAGVRSVPSNAASKALTSIRTSKAADGRRDNSSSVPLEKQTRGNNVTTALPRLPVASSEPNEVSSRNVLLWAPFHNEFSPWTEEETLETIFSSSPTGFNVKKLQNEQADINALKTMTNYGFVLLSTHGSGGKWILTGEPINDASKYEIEQLKGEIALTQHMIITEKDGVKVKAPVYAVNHKWIENELPGTFNNTFIINSSCESTKTNNLWDAFSAKGAGAYYGFSEIVSSRFAHDKSIEIVENLVNEGKTTGESFAPGNDPYHSLKAAIQLKGKTSLKFAENENGETNLFNGDFEQHLSGWQTSGDGRVISGMGSGSTNSLAPTSGKAMGVISTGLGYTTSMGEISQTFFLNEKSSSLSFDWNYLSEEFLSYIGSGYNDPFNVTLRTSDGTQEEVLRLTVNSIAEQFDATQENGGGLIPVSPDIVFDVGDVWMTGWQNMHYVIPDQFKGKAVTLTFSAEDAGDTVYDTAVLLDSIKVK